jgi:chromosome segregation and condensation protein ScpB
MNTQDAKCVLEAALLCAPQPLSLADLRILFADGLAPDALHALLDELHQIADAHECFLDATCRNPENGKHWD